MTDQATLQKILDTPMKTFDHGEITPRAYLKLLLTTLWEEEESFSGKRPFGNSGWQYDLDTGLVEGGFITGTIEDGWAEYVDTDARDALILELIAAL